MTHDAVWERLPDLLLDRDDGELLAHVNGCHECQRQLFRLARVDRILRRRAAEAARSGRVRRRRVAAAAALVAAAAAVAVGTHRDRAVTDGFTLRTHDGALVARGQIQDADGDNQAVRLAAHGLPAKPTDTYLLWTRSADDGRPLLVGRFMVSRTGECRARFNLAGRRHPAQFWITPSSAPKAVVAST